MFFFVLFSLELVGIRLLTFGLIVGRLVDCAAINSTIPINTPQPQQQLPPNRNVSAPGTADFK